MLVSCASIGQTTSSTGRGQGARTRSSSGVPGHGGLLASIPGSYLQLGGGHERLCQKPGAGSLESWNWSWVWSREWSCWSATQNLALVAPLLLHRTITERPGLVLARSSRSGAGPEREPGRVQIRGARLQAGHRIFESSNDIAPRQRSGSTFCCLFVYLAPIAGKREQADVKG